jgi:ATP-dependent HslUV protease ATP-binding subunit HslU
VLVQEKLLDGIVGTSEDETFIKSMRLALAEGEMEDNKIDVTVSSRSTGSDKASAISVDSTVSGFEIFKLSKDGKGGKKGEKKKMTVAEARPIIEESEIERLMDEHDIPKEAIAAVEVRRRIENEEERKRERRRREREGESSERHLYTNHLT